MLLGACLHKYIMHRPHSLSVRFPWLTGGLNKVKKTTISDFQWDLIGKVWSVTVFPKKYRSSPFLCADYTAFYCCWCYIQHIQYSNYNLSLWNIAIKAVLYCFPCGKIVLMCSVIFEEINEINYNLYCIVIAWASFLSFIMTFLSVW